MVDLEYYWQGWHYIIYRNNDEALLVVDFIHGTRDLEVIIQDLSKPEYILVNYFRLNLN